MENFAGKVALVTGANSGIGKATAIAFAELGARVVVAARRIELGEEVAAQIKSRGQDAIFVRTDVSKAEDVEGLLRTTLEAYGRLDYAVNNAASEPGALTPVADLTETEFYRVIDVNLKGVWLCMKYEIQQMLRQQPSGGAIVNVSSVNGLGGVAGGSFYAASKSGVIALAKSAAQEYGRHGIRVNALVAGTFKTPMLDEALDIASGRDPQAREALEERIKGLISLGRIAQPEEAAQVIVWLCSDSASYVTGHSMIADGGLTAWAR
jgi:NAD(P)-dependent dehydrogenase (short-subunit alcohol dehydrogenase family)